MPSDYLLALLTIHAHDTLVKTKAPGSNHDDTAKIFFDYIWFHLFDENS